MITVKELLKFIEDNNISEDVKVYAYEGEATGIVFTYNGKQVAFLEAPEITKKVWNYQKQLDFSFVNDIID